MIFDMKLSGWEKNWEKLETHILLNPIENPARLGKNLVKRGKTQQNSVMFNKKSVGMEWEGNQGKSHVEGDRLEGNEWLTVDGLSARLQPIDHTHHRW